MLAMNAEANSTIATRVSVPEPVWAVVFIPISLRHVALVRHRRPAMRATVLKIVRLCGMMPQGELRELVERLWQQNDCPSPRLLVV